MATSLITRNFRSVGEDRDSEPEWLKRQVTSGLQSISRRACVHPIHTIVVIALLASTTYVGLLEGSFFDTVRNPRDLAGQVDVDLLLQGSRNLRLGESTSWKWQVEDGSSPEEQKVDYHHFSDIIEAMELTNSLLSNTGFPTPRIGYFHLPRFYLQVRFPRW